MFKSNKFLRGGRGWGLVVLALLGVVVAGFMRLSWDVEILKMLPQRLEQVRGLSVLLRHFSLPDELVISLSGEDAERVERMTLSLAEALRTKPGLVGAVVAESPWESKPEQLAELVAYAAWNLPKEKFRSLAESLSPEKAKEIAEESLESIGASFSVRDVLLRSYDPLQMVSQVLPMDEGVMAELSEFASSDGTFRVLYVKSAGEFASYKEIGVWIEAVRAEIAEWTHREGADDLRVGITGEPAFVAEISSGMERDMRGSGMGTIAFVGLIFWLFYRRLRPLLLLVGMMLLCFVLALAFVGIFHGNLTVISVGFGSIMIGLSIDYGFVVYHLRREHGEVKSLRRHAFPGVFWAAATTCGGFLSLSFAGFPALSQLGILVAAGAAISAVLMLGPFADWLCRWDFLGEVKETRLLYGIRTVRVVAVGTTLAFLFLLGVLWVRGFPAVETNTRALHPQDSPAFGAMEEMERRLGGKREMVNVLVEGSSEAEVATRLATAAHWAEGLKKEGIVTSYYLPESFWPEGERQAINAGEACGIVKQKEKLVEVLEEAGFTGEAFALTDGVFSFWERWGATGKFPVWLEEKGAGWILRRAVHRKGSEYAAMGLFFPAEGLSDEEKDRLFTGPEEGIYAVTWGRLGEALAREVGGSYIHLGLLFCGAMGVLLLFAYRNVFDLALTAISVGASFFALVGTMSLLGWSWNFFSLAALVLIVGTGVDYPIHVIFALREARGNFLEVIRTMGYPLTLCTLTTLVGFGSLGFVTNIGLASLGKVCAVGIFYNYLWGMFLVPLAWQWWWGKRASV